MDKIIQLQVGNRKFTTFQSTLFNDSPNFFSNLLRGCPMTDDKMYFIDRDEESFSIILDYLRGYELQLPTDTILLSKLSQDADFYNLHNLVKILHEQKLEITSDEKYNAMNREELIKELEKLNGLHCLQSFNDRNDIYLKICEKKLQEVTATHNKTVENRYEELLKVFGELDSNDFLQEFEAPIHFTDFFKNNESLVKKSLNDGYLSFSLCCSIIHFLISSFKRDRIGLFKKILLKVKYICTFIFGK